ncbi:acyl-homoserine-lactone synthase, partial [Oxalobacteraceae bacterium A2-2]
MNVIAGHTGALSTALYTDMARYRHKVFIETLGWELTTQNGEELDQFDRPDTVY